MNSSAPAWPFTRPGRRPRDWPAWVVPLMLAPFVIAGSFGAQDNADSDPHAYATNELDPFGVVLLVSGVVVLLFRRRFPVITAGIVGTLTMLYFLRAYPYGPFPIVPTVALIALVGAGHRILAWAGTYTGLAAFLVVSTLIGVDADQRGQGDALFPVERPTLVGGTMTLLWTVAVLTIAELVRMQSERAAEAERRHRERERRRASEERLRIARELHDVLAHNISLINVQAGVALHLMDERPEQARTALAAIKEASKEALTEMRSVIGVLRNQGESAPRSPTAGLARLDELLDRARGAGLRVHAEIDPPPDVPLPAGPDLAAFRIVQESLTN
ncbi:MAG TPA: histidine kinase dimerization/phosphoacceptor domain-containing protein, partial [Thermomonospora sp.]|nr:histidine kinase dimerization/phosphoacceptor domain-containing protein [Thermomonospora sp.]